ncbi:MAG: sigma-70 family RNA polymerase sigma factor [Myxococcales bacterium]|nr:sigma-70 family RNA polymerase sigma factor [Myxococcales bacterium]
MTDIDAPDEEPTSPPSATPSPAAGFWLALALILLALLALPLLALTAFGGVLPIYLITAEALQHTDGFVRAEFDGALRAAWILNLTVLGACLIRRVRQRRDPARRPWRPLAWLWGGYLAGIWLTVPTDIFGAIDVPERITSFFLLGAAELAGLMIPTLLLVLLARLLATLWRTARASLPGYRRVVGLSSALGLGTATVAGAVALGVDAGYLGEIDGDLTRDAETAGIDWQESDYDSYVWASSALQSRSERRSAHATPSVARRAEPAPAEPFADCADRLASPRSGEPAQISRAIDHLQARWHLSRADAEDIAMTALLKTCRAYAAQPHDHLVETYWTALRNESTNRYRRQRTQDRFAGALDDVFADTGQPPSPAELILERQRVQAARAAYQRLPYDDQRIIQLRLEGHAYDEIARRVGITPSAARKRHERAFEKLRQDTPRELRWGFDE